MENKILAYIEKIPALSPTMAKILELASNPSTSAGDLVKVIKLDPVLTVKILKLINSAYFGMTQQITSINRAIVLLGLNTIKNLALSVEVLSSFDLGKGSQFDVNRFWEHSLACAVASKLLAGKVVADRQKHEEYFVAGLIHDIGKIFLMKFFPDEYMETLNKVETHKDSLREEKETFTLDHAEVGALIAEKWSLSEEMVEAIRAHHTHPVEGEGTPSLNAIVFASNIYCKLTGYNDIEQLRIEEEIGEALWQAIPLEGAQAEELLSQLPQKVEEAKGLINKEGG